MHIARDAACEALATSLARVAGLRAAKLRPADVCDVASAFLDDSAKAGNPNLRLFILFGSAQDTPARQNTNCVCFCPRLFILFGSAQDTLARQNTNCVCFCPRLFVSLHRRPALSLLTACQGRKVRATQSTAQANDLMGESLWQRNRKRPPRTSAGAFVRQGPTARGKGEKAG